MILAATVMGSAVGASTPCGKKACSEEVSAGLGAAARAACFKQVKAACEAGLCSCTGTPACICDPVPGGCSCHPPTTTTTTTLPPPTCASGPFPTCAGTCPAGKACFANELDLVCDCFPDGTQPCTDSMYPICNGTCPAGEECGLLSVLGPCGCVPAGTVACGETALMCSNGTCPRGQECSFVRLPALDYCTCAPVGVPCCEGGATCGPGEVCTFAGSICLCASSCCTGGTPCEPGKVCRSFGPLCLCGSPSGAFLE